MEYFKIIPKNWFTFSSGFIWFLVILIPRPNEVTQSSPGVQKMKRPDQNYHIPLIGTYCHIMSQICFGSKFCNHSQLSLLCCFRRKN